MFTKKEITCGSCKSLISSVYSSSDQSSLVYCKPCIEKLTQVVSKFPDLAIVSRAAEPVPKVNKQRDNKATASVPEISKVNNNNAATSVPKNKPSEPKLSPRNTSGTTGLYHQEKVKLYRVNKKVNGKKFQELFCYGPQSKYANDPESAKNAAIERIKEIEVEHSSIALPAKTEVANKRKATEVNVVAKKRGNT